MKFLVFRTVRGGAYHVPVVVCDTAQQAGEYMARSAVYDISVETEVSDYSIQAVNTYKENRL